MQALAGGLRHCFLRHRLYAILVGHVVVHRQPFRPHARVGARRLIVAREQRRNGAHQGLLRLGKLLVADLAGLHLRQLLHELGERLRGLLGDHAARRDERACLAMRVVEAEYAVRVRMLGAQVAVQARVEAQTEDVVHHAHGEDVRRRRGDADFPDPDLRLRRAGFVHQRDDARRFLRMLVPRALRRPAVLPVPEAPLQHRHQRRGIGIADDEERRVRGTEPRFVPGDDVLARDRFHRAHGAFAGIAPRMLLAEDHAREDVAAHRLRIVERLRDLSEPLDPDALDVGGAKLRVEGDVGEDLQDRFQRVGDRRDGDARRVRFRGAAVACAEILELPRDGRGIARGCPFVEQVQRERGEACLARRIGVRARAQSESDGDQWDVMALDEEHRKAVLQRELGGDGSAEFHRRPRRGRPRAERRVGSALRLRACGGRLRLRRLGQGLWRARRASDQERDRAKERLHRPPPAEACFCSGSTMITTRCSSLRYCCATFWTWAGVAASVASRFFANTPGSWANIS